MFKKLLIAGIALFGIALSGQARDTYAHDASALPVAAQTVLKNNFKSEVSIVKIEKSFGRISEYEVIMTDGAEITFDKDGNWESVEVSARKSVPDGFVPKAISDYVKKNQPGQKIIGIEKERSGYEVELTNGVDMKFDKAGNFVRYED